MDRYTPRLSHAVFLILLALILFIGSAYWLSDSQFLAASFASAMLVLFSIIVMGWITNQERIDYYDSLARLSDSIRNLGQDQWQALGIKFPSLRIKWKGNPISYIEDTEITVEQLARFLKDSTPSETSPRRNWGNGRDGRVWTNIHAWLVENNYIMTNSASGQHSWLWRGQSFFQIRERYLNIKVIDDPEFMAGAPTEYPKPLETMSGSHDG